MYGPFIGSRVCSGISLLGVVGGYGAFGLGIRELGIGLLGGGCLVSGIRPSLGIGLSDSP